MASRNVTFDSRSMIIDGERRLLLSGAVHYARVLPEDWDRVFQLAREMGINTIQTYFMWNFHEPHRGNWSWTGRRDLSAFIRAAAKRDLEIILRIGPYVCGEYYFGGIPTWLRGVDDVQCFRCSDPVWKREMARVVAAVVDEVRPLLAVNGGNVLMLQVENEYNGGDQSYLDWAVDMALDTTKGEGALWNLCHDHKMCASTNHRGPGGDYEFRALCTINGFWMDEYDSNPSQPSPKWLKDVQADNPGQFMAWTEDQGWFDQWSVGQRVRESADQLYGVARFLAYGGSFHNHYMLTGGSNFGLQSGGEVVTAYAPDTVIDSFLLRHEPRFSYYGKFYNLVDSLAPTLLSVPIPAAQNPPSNASTGPVSVTASLAPCSDTDPAHIGKLDPSQQWDLSRGLLESVGNPGLCLDPSASPKTPKLSNCTDTMGWSVTASVDGKPFHSQVKSNATFKCEKKGATGKCYRCLDAEESSNALDLWDCKEKGDQMIDNQFFYYGANERGVRNNRSDLCLTAASSGSNSAAELHVYGDIAFVSNTDDSEWLKITVSDREYVLQNKSVKIVNITSGEVLFDTAYAMDPPIPPTDDEDVDPARVNEVASTSWDTFVEAVGNGSRVVSSDSGPIEQLNLTENDSDYLWYTTDLPEGTKGDPQVDAKTGYGTILDSYVDTSANTINIFSVAMGLSNGGVGPGSVKGITGSVKIGGKDVTSQRWRHSWMLAGETLQIFAEDGTGRVEWKPADTKVPADTRLAWFRARIDMPKAMARAGDGPEQLAYALDLSTMWKGQAWVNGFNLGRYWAVAGKCSGACAPPVKNGHCYMHWKGCGRATQTLYHIPTSVLKPTGNLVVLFEETSSQPNPDSPPRDLSGVSIVALKDHPKYN